MNATNAPVDLANESVASKEDPSASIDLAVKPVGSQPDEADPNPCLTCGGDGQLNGGPCPDCEGTGRMPELGR